MKLIQTAFLIIFMTGFMSSCSHFGKKCHKSGCEVSKDKQCCAKACSHDCKKKCDGGDKTKCSGPQCDVKKDQKQDVAPGMKKEEKKKKK